MEHATTTHAGPSVLTALVVDDSFAARARITTLLHLGGWRVHQAVGTDRTQPSGATDGGRVDGA